jgi:hypothetical protein
MEYEWEKQIMKKKEEDGKGLLGRLFGRAQPKASPCCGGTNNESAPEENKGCQDEGKTPKDKKPCCCG